MIRPLPSAACFFLAALPILAAGCGQGSKATKPTKERTVKTETATLGAGCFWCVEAVLEQLDGVSLRELRNLFDAVNRLFSALSPGWDYLTLRADPMPCTIGCKLKRTCLYDAYWMP